MSAAALDHLTVTDQRVLDPTELTPLLEQVAPEPEPVSIWLTIWEWLRQRFLDRTIAENQWLEAFADWLLRYSFLFEYVFYLLAAGLVLFVCYLFWLLFTRVEFSSLRGSRPVADTEVAGMSELLLVASNDPVIQNYVEFLRWTDDQGLVPQPFTRSPRELAGYLADHSATHPIAERFQTLARDVEGYLYGEKTNNQPELRADLAEMMEAARHE